MWTTILVRVCSALHLKTEDDMTAEQVRAARKILRHIDDLNNDPEVSPYIPAIKAELTKAVR